MFSAAVAQLDTVREQLLGKGVKESQPNGWNWWEEALKCTGCLSQKGLTLYPDLLS
jgi:hypothetical protein